MGQDRKDPVDPSRVVEREGSPGKTPSAEGEAGAPRQLPHPDEPRVAPGSGEGESDPGTSREHPDPMYR